MPRHRFTVRLQGVLLLGLGAVLGALAVISSREVRGQKESQERSTSVATAASDQHARLPEAKPRRQGRLAGT